MKIEPLEKYKEETQVVITPYLTNPSHEVTQQVMRQITIDEVVDKINEIIRELNLKEVD
jgi:hypothetical protein